MHNKLVLLHSVRMCEMNYQTRWRIFSCMRVSIWVLFSIASKEMKKLSFQHNYVIKSISLIYYFYLLSSIYLLITYKSGSGQSSFLLYSFEVRQEYFKYTSQMAMIMWTLLRPIFGLTLRSDTQKVAIWPTEQRITMLRFVYEWTNTVSVDSFL